MFERHTLKRWQMTNEEEYISTMKRQKAAFFMQLKPKDLAPLLVCGMGVEMAILIFYWIFTDFFTQMAMVGRWAL